MHPAAAFVLSRPFISALFGLLSVGLAHAAAPAYFLPTYPGVKLHVLMTAGDKVPHASLPAQTYRMAGTPDGLGAYDNGDGSLTLLMNHELGSHHGAVRAHGSQGAFVSQWRIRKRDLALLSGQDLIQTLHTANGQSTSPIRHLCSADLAPLSAYYNHKTGKGWRAGRLFLNGEEARDGRAFAHVANGALHGQSYQLDALGQAAFENLLANPYEQDKTLVIATDDRHGGKVLVYVGHKQTQGSPAERAGLTNGKTMAIQLDATLPGRFSLVSSGGTPFPRPEDGAWDTLDPRRFYFVTTDRFNGQPRLWELRFDDLAQPERGGTARIVLEAGQHGIQMPDNLAVDDAGAVYLQEDVGNNPHLGAIWRYQAQTGKLDKLAQANPAFFSKGSADFLTENEESSGIIDVSQLFAGVPGYDTKKNRYFLFVVQAHHAMPDEVVSGGQLLLMQVPR